MTTKKATTKKPGTLEDRALAIINAPKGSGSDRDTRRAVELSLEDLREIVRRAEYGEMICDTTDPQLQDAPPTSLNSSAPSSIIPTCPPKSITTSPRTSAN